MHRHVVLRVVAGSGAREPRADRRRRPGRERPHLRTRERGVAAMSVKPWPSLRTLQASSVAGILVLLVQGLLSFSDIDRTGWALVDGHLVLIVV
jgi:hypothetical protein